MTWVRGKGFAPITAASAGLGFIGFMKAALGLRRDIYIFVFLFGTTLLFFFFATAFLLVFLFFFFFAAIGTSKAEGLEKTNKNLGNSTTGEASLYPLFVKWNFPRKDSP